MSFISTRKNHKITEFGRNENPNLDVKACFIRAVGVYQGRLATQLVITQIGAASITLGGLGAVFILVGTAVNVALLAVDLVTAAKDLLASDSHKYFKNQWALFQSKPGELTADQIRKANLKVVDATRSNDVILLGTNVNSLYNKTFDIAKLYRTDIYEQYRTYYGGWGLVANPLKKAEDSLEEIDRLGLLSWRAIIPLYLQGFDEDFIEDSVKIISKPRKRQKSGKGERNNALRKASDFIEYYKAVKKGAGDELDNIPEEFTIVDARGQRVSIALLLEMGDFIAPIDQSFFKSHLWRHPSFWALPE